MEIKGGAGTKKGFRWGVFRKRIDKNVYRVGHFVLVLAAMAPFQRQVSGQPQLVLLHGFADELKQLGLDARPVGTAIVQQLPAELEHGFRRLRTKHVVMIDNRKT